MDENIIVQTEHKTIEEINYLRGFGVLAVIAIHTTGYFTEIKSYNTLVLLNIWTDVFSQFAVPLFILISGFVLARKYRFDFSLTEFYKKRIRSIIPQYLIFSILYTLFNNWAVMQSNPLSANLALMLNNIIHSNASYHLWFFSIIIQLYILYPIIIKIFNFCKRIDRAEYMIAILLIIQTLWMVSIHSSSSPYIKLNFMSFLFYFGLGIYIVDYFDQLKKASKHLTPIYLITSLALTIGSSFFITIGLTTGHDYYSIPGYFFIGSELIYPVLRITTFILLLNLAASLVGRRSLLAKVIYRIGDYSFGIYLIHIFFNQYAIKILKNNAIDYNNWTFYPIVFVITAIFSYVVVRLISYVPYSYYIIGHRNQKRKTRT